MNLVWGKLHIYFGRPRVCWTWNPVHITRWNKVLTLSLLTSWARCGNHFIGVFLQESWTLVKKSGTLKSNNFLSRWLDNTHWRCIQLVIIESRSRLLNAFVSESISRWKNDAIRTSCQIFPGRQIFPTQGYNKETIWTIAHSATKTNMVIASSLQLFSTDTLLEGPLQRNSCDNSGKRKR